MAFEAYLKIKAKKQGDIKGLCRQNPYQDQIVINAYSWGIDGSQESLSFQDLEKRSVVSGRRVHRPLIVRRDVDYVTPMVLMAMFSHEVLREVELTIVGQEMSRPKMMTIALSDAILTTVSHETEGWERPQEFLHLIYNEIDFTTHEMDVKSGQNKGQAMAMDTVPRNP